MFKRIFIIFICLLVIVIGLGFYISFNKSLVNQILSVVFSKIGGTNVDITSPGNVTYNDAKAQYSTTNSLPQGFPVDFPLKSTTKITSSWKTLDSVNSGYSLVASDSGSLTTNYDYYLMALPNSGWKIDSQNQTSQGATISFEKDNFKGFMGLTVQGASTIFSINIGETK